MRHLKPFTHLLTTLISFYLYLSLSFPITFSLCPSRRCGTSGPISVESHRNKSRGRRRRRRQHQSATKEKKKERIIRIIDRVFLKCISPAAVFIVYYTLDARPIGLFRSGRILFQRLRQILAFILAIDVVITRGEIGSLLVQYLFILV